MKGKKEVKAEDILPYIKPENRLSKENMEELINTEEIQPIIEIVPKESQPLIIYVADIKEKEGNERYNVMITIMHKIGKDTLEVRGRTRNERTGEKTTFGAKPEKYSKKSKSKMEEIIKEYQKTIKERYEIKKETTLEFKKNEDLKSILQEMEKSNLFNFGQVDLNEK
jgi:hypothetical protein